MTDGESVRPGGGFLVDDRSVSEVLGYIIVFGLVITSVGFVMVSGMSSLENVRDAEQASNAERAFDVVGENMGAIYERNAPSRATEIDLGDSEIYYGEPVTITVDVDGEDPIEHELRPVVLNVNDETDLVYEGGAVFREERDGGIVLRDPPLVFAEERIHAPIIKTTAPTVESAGSTTVLLRGQSTDRSVAFSDTDYGNEDVTVNVTSPRYELWERYFEEETALEHVETNEDDEWVEFETDEPDTVYVTVQEIELSLIL